MKSPQKREVRKVKKPLPTLEELKFPNHRKLSHPKKNNKQALKRIKRGELLWDRKKVERVAQRRIYGKHRRFNSLHSNLNKHKLTEKFRNDFLKLVPSWKWNNESESFQTISGNDTVSREEISEIIVATYEIPYESVPIRIDGLTPNQHLVMEYVFPAGSAIGGTRIKSDERPYPENYKRNDEIRSLVYGVLQKAKNTKKEEK